MCHFDVTAVTMVCGFGAKKRERKTSEISGSERAAVAVQQRWWRRRWQHSCSGQQGGRAAMAEAARQQQQQRSNGSGCAVATAAVAASAARQQRWQRQRDGGSVAVAASLAAWRQHCGSAASLAAAPRREAWVAQWFQRGGGRQSVSSAMEVGMAAANAATAVLPLRSTVVVTKTPAATAMVGAQITTNNQLKGWQQLGNGDGNG